MEQDNIIKLELVNDIDPNDKEWSKSITITEVGVCLVFGVSTFTCWKLKILAFKVIFKGQVHDF